MRHLLIAATMLAVSAPAQASFYDGNQVHEWCSADGPEIGLCSGYVAGVADTAALFDDKPFCAHTGVEVRQMRDVVVNYLDQFPEKRHYPAQALVLVALSEAFPCP